MRRGDVESRLLILVTLGLVAFGLVMVYSATSAAATLGGKDPTYYLKRQGIYAALGIVLMMVAQRWDYRRLRRLAPTLVIISLALLCAVLVIGPAINGARRWISLGPAVSAIGSPARGRNLGGVVLRDQEAATPPARAVAPGRCSRPCSPCC
jgi:cell division protein FtsW (lipid II flippase)